MECILGAYPILWLHFSRNLPYLPYDSYGEVASSQSNQNSLLEGDAKIFGIRPDIDSWH